MCGLLSNRQLSLVRSPSWKTAQEMDALRHASGKLPFRKSVTQLCRRGHAHCIQRLQRPGLRCQHTPAPQGCEQKV